MEDWLELKQIANRQLFEADDMNWDRDDEDDLVFNN